MERRQRGMRDGALGAMRWRSMERHVAAVAAALIGVLAAVQAAAQDAGVSLSEYWTVIDVRGSADLAAGSNPWNEPGPMAPGDLIGPYQAITVSSGSEVVLARGGDIIRIRENTTLALPAPAAGGADTRINQQGGNVYYLVSPRRGPSFEVFAEFLIAGVKGTQFAITNDASSVSVTEGVVNVRSIEGCAAVDVPAGFTVSVDDPCPDTIELRPLSPDEASAISDPLDEAANEILPQSGIQPLNELLNTVTEGAAGALEDVTDTLDETLDGATGGATETLQDTTGGLTDTIEDTTGGVTDTIEDTTGGITDTIEDATGGAGNLLNLAPSSGAPQQSVSRVGSNVSSSDSSSSETLIINYGDVGPPAVEAPGPAEGDGRGR